jgi:hypothetical protein
MLLLLLLGGLQGIAGGHRHADTSISHTGFLQTPRLRMSSHGHIQLCVLSAENLMPAKKVD